MSAVPLEVAAVDRGGDAEARHRWLAQTTARHECMSLVVKLSVVWLQHLVAGCAWVCALMTRLDTSSRLNVSLASTG